MLTLKYAVRDLPQALSQNTLKEQGKDFTASQRQHTEPDLALGNPFSSRAAPLDSAVGQAEQLARLECRRENQAALQSVQGQSPRHHVAFIYPYRAVQRPLIVYDTISGLLD